MFSSDPGLRKCDTCIFTFGRHLRMPNQICGNCIHGPYVDCHDRRMATDDAVAWERPSTGDFGHLSGRSFRLFQADGAIPSAFFSLDLTRLLASRIV